MKKVFFFIMMVAASVGMMLMSSTESMAAPMPASEFAGITIQKGTMNNMPYETGGVGLEERAAMKGSIDDYNVRLIFATRKGLYLDSIPVQIKTLDGKVLLSKESNGPWFWVKLPAGRYEVSATYNDKKEVLKVDAGMSPRSVEFAWKGAK